jgi:hypothetical protein
MPSIFREFSNTYQELKEKLPNHPLTEEIRRAVGRSRFPNEEWIRAKTHAMKELLSPWWQKAS